jgi:hypothetical protein
LTAFSDLDIDSIKAAVSEDITASEAVRTTWLDIVGIEYLDDSPGNFVYRLVLSSPMQFGADQTVRFHTRNSTETIQAVIVRSDDDGRVVECKNSLPSTD